MISYSPRADGWSALIDAGFEVIEVEPGHSPVRLWSGRLLSMTARPAEIEFNHAIALGSGACDRRTQSRARAEPPRRSCSLKPAPSKCSGPSTRRHGKLKDAFLRKRLTDRQIAVAYHYLTRTDHDVAGGLGMATYGGKVNTVAPEATASAQRESILTMSCSTGWADPQDEARSLAWVRQFYRDLFADTGGVPVPGEVGNGALINHPDVDLADPEWNTSGVPWHTLYYKDNYQRLQQIKARWDPGNVFHHTLSIRPTNA